MYRWVANYFTCFNIPSTKSLPLVLILVISVLAFLMTFKSKNLFFACSLFERPASSFPIKLESKL